MTSRGSNLEGKQVDRTFNLNTVTDPAAPPTRGAGARIVALLAVLGGAGILTAIVAFFGALLATPPQTWAGLWSDPVLGVVMLVGGTGGFLVLCVALAGLGFVVGPKRDPRIVGVAALGAIGGFTALWFPAVMLAMPVAALIVAIHLARVGRLPKSIAVFHVTALLGSILVVGLWAQNASLGWGDLIVLLYPVSWIAIGLALFRGLPTSASTA